MPFPVTIDPNVGGAEQPGKFATFFHGTDRYQIQFILDPGNAQAFLAAFKSIDGGVTWAEMDSGGRPVANYFGIGFTVPYCCCQISVTGIQVIFYELASGDVSATSFDMGTDTWSGASVTIAPPLGAYPTSGEGGFRLGQYSAAYRSGTNDVVFVLAGDIVFLDDVGHAICWFAVYDVGGSTWNVGGDLGYEDYADITTWDMLPSGIVYDSATGITTVIMQQVARAGPGTMQTQVFDASGDFYAPLDSAATAVVQRIGAGAGAASSGANGKGGGGGGAWNQTDAQAITPGNTYPFVIGVGGATGSAGGNTTAFAVSANGGSPGSTGTGGAGGAAAGGDSSHKGGAGGGNGATLNGGGGGGSGTPTVDGGDGQDGQPGINPPQAAGGVGSGDGGTGGAILITPNGSPGSSPGGGGGGDTSATVSPTLGIGADGRVIVSWLNVRNTHDCRIYQQAILADNSLGTLTEITQGAYPSRAQGATPVPISCDVAVFNGSLAIAFTGATSTTGRDLIGVLDGTIADPVSFGFQTFACDNGGNNRDSCPALAIGIAATYCAYISTPDGGPASFVYRADPGLGFGAPALIGTLDLPDDRAYSRLQASVIVTLPEVTFGTPTTATFDLQTPD